MKSARVEKDTYCSGHPAFLCSAENHSCPASRPGSYLSSVSVHAALALGPITSEMTRTVRFPGHKHWSEFHMLLQQIQFACFILIILESHFFAMQGKEPARI